MDRRDRDAYGASSHPDRSERDHAAWEDDWDAPRRPRTGIVRRVVSLVKVAAFVLPVALFLYGSVADCSGRPAAAGWFGLIGAGACARTEMIGTVLSMQDNFALLRRLID